MDQPVSDSAAAEAEHAVPSRPADPVVPGTGSTVLAIIGSLMMPLLGVLLYFIYLPNPQPEFRRLGRNALIAALIGYGLVFLFVLCYVAVIMVIFVAAGAAAAAAPPARVR